MNGMLAREYEVVARIGGIEITRREMRCYLDRVAPQKGVPIDCKIYVACDFDLLAIHCAIELLIGKPPTLTPLPDPTSLLGCRYRIQAEASDRDHLLD